MKISFVVNPIYTYDKVGWQPTDDFLAGTEESVVEWASALAAKGHTVLVYRNSGQGNIGNLVHRGVVYRERERYVKEAGRGVTVNVKSYDIPVLEPSVYLTNETTAGDLDLHEFRTVILPSKWAMDNLGVEHSNIRVLAHGYDSTAIYPEEKMKNQCLYSSSPDRGLAELARHWPQVVKAVPDATLIVTYDGDLDLPGVMSFGTVDNETMASLYRTSDFWLHPCTGGELFCMAAVEAQVAQAIPVFYPTMALGETVRHGIRADQENFADRLIGIMNDSDWQQDIRYKLSEEHYMDWSDTANILERIINE